MDEHFICRNYPLKIGGILITKYGKLNHSLWVGTAFVAKVVNIFADAKERKNKREESMTLMQTTSRVQELMWWPDAPRYHIALFGC